MIQPPAPPPAIVAAAPVSAPAEVGLVDVDGRPFTLAELRGQWVWIYLGFASCPDACPRTLDVLTATFASLPEGAPVRPVFVSVDPRRDTPERLKAYTRYYHPKLLGASGPHGALDALTMALGTRYEVPKAPKPDENYQVGHPDEVFVLDPDGRYVGRLDAKAPDLEARLVGEFAQPVAAWRAKVATQAPPAPPLSTSAAWCGLPDLAAIADPDPLRDPRMHRAATLGSGTSVLPGTTPMRMWAGKGAGWLWMAHLNAVGGAWATGAAPTFGLENWQKAMGSAYVGPGLLDLRLMTTAEPWTTPAQGLPRLGVAPTMGHGAAHHPLQELAARYTWTPVPAFSAFAYAGLAGEPALGPGAAMHRPSAADLPGLPLAASVLEAGHGAHGVATLGARLGDVQLEGSGFRGRMPDPRGAALQLGTLDSWAARASWFPGRYMVAQASYGAIEGVHGHPGQVRRLTGSVLATFNAPLGRFSAGATFAQAHDGLADDPSRAWGLEAQLDRLGVQHWYGRAEWLTGPAWGPAPVGALTLGAVHDWGAVDRVAIGLGADVTGASSGAALVRMFVRVRPPTLTHPDDRDLAADGP